MRQTRSSLAKPSSGFLRYTAAACWAALCFCFAWCSLPYDGLHNALPIMCRLLPLSYCCPKAALSSTLACLCCPAGLQLHVASMLGHHFMSCQLYIHSWPSCCSSQAALLRYTLQFTRDQASLQTLCKPARPCRPATPTM